MTLTRQRLRAHLVATGSITDSGVGRAVRLRACTRCGAAVARGLDADVAAFDVSVDPTPLDPIGELLAVAGGRTTYNAMPGRTGVELNPRTPAHIALPRAYPVLADHRCGQPLPAVHDDEIGGDVDDDTPPF